MSFVHFFSSYYFFLIFFSYLEAVHSAFLQERSEKDKGEFVETTHSGVDNTNI